MTTDIRPPHMERLNRQLTHGELIDDLTGALAGIPALPGAACRGSTDWDWDIDQVAEPMAARDARLADAMARCHRCPALTACRAWVDALPEAERPTGAVAGRVVPPLAERRKAARRKRPVGATGASKAVPGQRRTPQGVSSATAADSAPIWAPTPQGEP